MTAVLIANFIACDCDETGSSGQDCNESSGQCACKDGFDGIKCDACAADSFGTFPNCQGWFSTEIANKHTPTKYLNRVIINNIFLLQLVTVTQ